jgi:hypothetical protein
MNGTTADRAGTLPADDEPVAVIVVHGVADQLRGQTAEAVAIQLALAGLGAVAGDSEVIFPLAAQ